MFLLKTVAIVAPVRTLKYIHTYVSMHVRTYICIQVRMYKHTYILGMCVCM